MYDILYSAYNIYFSIIFANSTSEISEAALGYLLVQF